MDAPARSFGYSAATAEAASGASAASSVTPAVFVRSFYFFDPNGVCLEFAAWTRQFTAADVAHEPMAADGRRVHGVIGGGGSPGSRRGMARVKTSFE